MSSEFQNMVDLMGKPGVIVQQFCGLDVGESTCPNEAVGEILVGLEGSEESIPIPVCEPHLEAIQKEFGVEELDA